MTIEVAVRHRLGRFALDVDIAVDGRVIALFGPSGSGKTSLVNIIAGLIRPDSGRVSVDGTTLVDTRQGIWTPPHRRRLGYIFQDARLLPHLSVRQNLLFGRWFAPNGERRASLRNVVELLGIGDLLERRPARLSGGEKQRVAIGRALLAEPRLLLMDEPLASLDDARKAEILPYIERLRDESRIPIILVSHGMPEVARLASAVVVMDHGHVGFVGSVDDAMQRIEQVRLSDDVQDPSRIDAEVVSHDDTYGLSVLKSKAGLWRVPRLELAPRSKLILLIDPSNVVVAIAPPPGTSALNVVTGKISALETRGALADIVVDCNGDVLKARLTRYSAEHLGLVTGRIVSLLIKSVTLNRRQATAI